MKTGTVIYLNGTSSSGKSCIAKILQETLEGCYLHTGVDHFMERLPAKFDVVSDGTTPPDADGFLLVFPDGGPRIAEIRPGPMGWRVLEGVYDAYAALAAKGVDLIVDDVLFDARMARWASSALAPFTVLFVGVRCPLEELERRERSRGDRVQGLARAHYDLVHAHGEYDLDVDTAKATPEECAARIRDRLRQGPPPVALRNLSVVRGP